LLDPHSSSRVTTGSVVGPHGRGASRAKAAPRRLVVGISGASGAVYGVELLRALRRAREEGRAAVETHVIVSEAARETIKLELGLEPAEVEALADRAHDVCDLTAPLSSGSFLTEGMVIAPCSIKTLSGIVGSFSANLLLRAADVTLKEGRKLILLVRETPLHKGHLRLMAEAADLGAVIMPPVPAFYHRPRTIEDLVGFTVGRVLDHLGIEHGLYRRWGTATDVE